MKITKNTVIAKGPENARTLAAQRKPFTYFVKDADGLLLAGEVTEKDYQTRKMEMVNWDVISKARVKEGDIFRKLNLKIGITEF